MLVVFASIVGSVLLFSFTLFLSLKIQRISNSADIFSSVYFTLLLQGADFPYLPHQFLAVAIGHHFLPSPFIAIMATTLLVAFELHLYVHLAKRYALQSSLPFLFAPSGKILQFTVVPIIHLGVHLRPILDILTGTRVSWYLQLWGES